MRSGAVLLVIIFIVMAITVISLGFMSNATMQMTCGQNTILRAQMDYLAQSGLVHAKTLLLNPQEVGTSPDGYWPGGSALQILQLQASDDYYDLTVTRSNSGPTNRCTYDIECQAYREKDGDKFAQSNLYAQLRLDPCIAYWAGTADSSLSNKVTVNGDVYCEGILTSSAVLNGDVFAADFTGNSTGQHYVLPVSPPEGVVFPDITIDYFSSTYDSGELSGIPSTPFASEDCNNLPAFEPGAGNPAGVLYRQGNLRLMGDVTIEGTLVVNGNLTIRGPGSTVIAPLKNFPAVVVNGTLTIENTAAVNIEGLVQANAMTVAADAGNITILGALFIDTSGMTLVPGYGGDITITTAPMLSSVNLISASTPDIKWSPAGDAFFKYIRRNPTP